jgi:hypothetical protein
MRRPVEIASEIAVGLAVVAGIFVLAIYFPGRDFPLKWLGLAATTAIIFGYSLYWTRTIPRPAIFWFYWTGFMVLHLALFVPLLIAVHQWPLIWFVFSTLVEFQIIYRFLLRVLAKSEIERAKRP